MLQARNIIKDYQVRVLHGIDVDIDEGSFVAIMGPSGSGKSTLLHILSGMDRPTDGTVNLDGENITALNEKQLAAVRLRKIGFIFQQPHLLQSLNLLDNIVLPGYFSGKEGRAEIADRAKELMDDVGIGELAGHSPTEVSGGQLQRAGICRALINEPAMIFGDEPTGALNQKTAAQILDLIGEIHRSGTTVVLVTHDPVVASRADRVLVLVDGQIADDLALGTYNPHDSESAEDRLNQVTELMRRRGV